jgi:D-lactate dehydrogenase
MVLLVATFSSKQWYDFKYLTASNKAFGSTLLFQFHSEALTAKTAYLAQGCNTVCTFVNDIVDEDCLNNLNQLGVEFVALRCAGFDSVNLLKAYELRGTDIVHIHNTNIINN